MLLSEMFWVERDTDFGVEGYSVTFKIATFLGEYEYLMYRWSAVLDWREAEGTLLCRVIAAAPAGIIHFPPPMTDEQREQLRHIYGLGGRYLAKDCDGKAFYYYEMPHNNGGYWHDGNDQVNDGFGLELLCSLSVCEILSKSDPEPYDIGKALWVEK